MLGQSCQDSEMENECCKLVLVRWHDSRQADGSWRYLGDLGPQKPVECASVGWLVQDDAETPVVCQTIGDLDDPERSQACGVKIIPTRCVVSMEVLIEEKATSASTVSDPVAA